MRKSNNDPCVVTTSGVTWRTGNKSVLEANPTESFAFKQNRVDPAESFAFKQNRVNSVASRDNSAGSTVNPAETRVNSAGSTVNPVATRANSPENRAENSGPLLPDTKRELVARSQRSSARSQAGPRRLMVVTIRFGKWRTRK